MLLRFLRQLASPQVLPPPTNWPRFFISMPLRGADESLKDALYCLLAQDYPDFEVHLVVDHESDPAWRIIREVIAETGTTRLKPATLQVRRENCSLLCSSLLQVLEGLQDQEGLLSFCAADMLPPPNWMREMATLMQHGEVGATLGNRWYLSPQRQWGSIVQYLWNSAAVVPMQVCAMPWGGALALRLHDIRRSGLIEQWAGGMVEDAPVQAAIRRLGLQLRFSPQLFVADRNECSLLRACQFMYRQLLWTRLYHPAWIVVVANAVILTSVMFAPFHAAALLGWQGDAQSALLLLATGTAYILGSALLGYGMDCGMRAVFRRRGEAAEPLSWRQWLRICAGIPLTPLLYAAAMMCVCLAKKVSWRGVTYELQRTGGVRRLGYRPYLETVTDVPPIPEADVAFAPK